MERDCLGSRGGVAATGAFFRNIGSLFGLVQFKNKVSSPLRKFWSKHEERRRKAGCPSRIRQMGESAPKQGQGDGRVRVLQILRERKARPSRFSWRHQQMANRSPLASSRRSIGRLRPCKNCMKFLDQSSGNIATAVSAKERSPGAGRFRGFSNLNSPRLRQAGPRPPHLLVQGSGQVRRCPISAAKLALSNKWCAP